MGELVPLSEGVPPEARELAAELRSFFQSLDISVRRYAARCNYDPATISRYLNGKRVPPWSFIQGLLTEVAEHRGYPVKQGALEVVRRLHRSALQTSNKHLHKVQVLQDKLAEADKEYKRAELREKALLEAMETRQRRIATLEVETLELNSSILEERNKSESLQRQVELIAPTEEELSKLRAEVRELKEQLVRAHELSEQAEARCEELEEQLREAEEGARSGQEAREQEQLGAALREAAEARSLADRLRDELEELRKETKAKKPNRSTPSAQPDSKNPTSEKLLTEMVLSKPPKELATELVRLHFLDELKAYSVLDGISRDYPLPKLGEVVLEIDKISTSLARTLMLMIGRARSPEDIFALIRDFGHHTIDDTSNLASSAVSWFTRNQDWSEIRSLMNLLRGAKWEEMAQQCIVDTSKNQSPQRFIATLEESSGAEREVLLRSLAHSRSNETLLELLSALNSSDTTLLVDVLRKIDEENPKRARSISRLLETLGIIWKR
ncbi:helix-turn-helix domain-containing protein [Streptomyces europaeiscabiei]|uniref:helix-turn-helix domain-containing protein n=1 Tax=Streptomyces europaeiscabiei TaxID=146819 RepID=UPI002E2D1600|nr:helix-turn-helix domain-containing protein [Streptomyces europaeiscabiei]